MTLFWPLHAASLTPPTYKQNLTNMLDEITGRLPVFYTSLSLWLLALHSSCCILISSTHGQLNVQSDLKSLHSPI